MYTEINEECRNIHLKVKEYFKIGRSNVLYDNKDSNYEALIQGIIAKKTLDNRSIRRNKEEIWEKACKGPESIEANIIKSIDDKLKRVLIECVPYLLTGAGCCLEHAACALIVADEILLKDTRIKMMNWVKDHQYLTVNLNKVEYVVDPWQDDESGKIHDESRVYTKSNTIKLEWSSTGGSLLSLITNMMDNVEIKNALNEAEKDVKKDLIRKDPETAANANNFTMYEIGKVG